MNTILVLFLIAAIAAALAFRRQLVALFVKPSPAVPTRRVVTLYKYTGYPNPVAPLGLYVPSLGRAPRTLGEAELAGWYADRGAALASPAEVAEPPPFGGTPQQPGERRLWQITGTVEGETLVEGTWSAITRADA